MTLGRRTMDLRGRREALGVTGRDMARGLGITLDVLCALECGSTPDDRLGFYLAWLSRLETAAPARREEQFKRAAAGRRFD